MALSVDSTGSVFSLGFGLAEESSRDACEKMTVQEFSKILEKGEQREVDFSVPGSGLCLERVEFGEGYFDL